MNLKSLIKEVERLNKRLIYCRNEIRKIKTKCNISYTIQQFIIENCELKIRDIENKLQGIKQTVEAVDKNMGVNILCSEDTMKDWQKLKELLGVK